MAVISTDDFFVQVYKGTYDGENEMIASTNALLVVDAAFATLEMVVDHMKANGQSPEKVN